MRPSGPHPLSFRCPGGRSARQTVQALHRPTECNPDTPRMPALTWRLDSADTAVLRFTRPHHGSAVSDNRIGPLATSTAAPPSRVPFALFSANWASTLRKCCVAKEWPLRRKLRRSVPGDYSWQVLAGGGGRAHAAIANLPKVDALNLRSVLASGDAERTSILVRSECRLPSFLGDRMSPRRRSAIRPKLTDAVRVWPIFSPTQQGSGSIFDLHQSCAVTILRLVSQGIVASSRLP